MVKKILLGMFLAVVAMATTTEAAVMNFRGNLVGGTNAGTFTLDFNVADLAGGTSDGTTERLAPFISGVNLVLQTGGTQTWNSASPNNWVRFTLDSLGNDVFHTRLAFTNGVMDFTYQINSALYSGSRDIDRPNVYNFMFLAGNQVPGVPWVSRADTFTVSGFGGAGAGSTIESVPEPGSMAALAFLTSGIAGFAYRRRKAKAKR